MKKVWIYLLIVTALVAGAAFVACGGGDDAEKESKDTPAAAETKEGGEEETPEAKETKETGEEGNGGGSISDVPVYPGAKKISSGEWSGSEAMLPVIGGDVDAGDYGKVQYGMYESDDSPDKIFEWYKDKMDGWKEEWTFSSGGEEGGGGMGIWSKDDGKTAAWVIIGEEGDTTSLMIAVGSQ